MDHVLERRFVQSPAHCSCGDFSSGFVLAQFRHETLLLYEPAAKTTPQELVKKAQELLTSVQCSEELLGSIGLTGERLILDGRFEWPVTKVIAVLLDAEASDVALADFHLKVSTRLATHLAPDRWELRHSRVAGSWASFTSAERGTAGGSRPPRTPEEKSHRRPERIRTLSAVERRYVGATW